MALPRAWPNSWAKRLPFTQIPEQNWAWLWMVSQDHDLSYTGPQRRLRCSQTASRGYRCRTPRRWRRRRSSRYSASGSGCWYQDHSSPSHRLHHHYHHYHHDLDHHDPHRCWKLIHRLLKGEGPGPNVSLVECFGLVLIIPVCKLGLQSHIGGTENIFIRLSFWYFLWIQFMFCYIMLNRMKQAVLTCSKLNKRRRLYHLCTILRD